MNDVTCASTKLVEQVCNKVEVVLCVTLTVLAGAEDGDEVRQNIRVGG